MKTPAATTPSRVTVESAAWPEIRPGDDLAALAAETLSLADGDVVVVASKVVSKSEGSLSALPKAEVVAAETARVVAQRGSTVIAETRHGLVLAAAGVDESNVDEGVVLSLPRDGDESARRLRAALAAAPAVNVAVVIADTAGRAWRQGQTDIAIGCAGIDPIQDLRGLVDGRGRVLRVTTPAAADEIAAMADLVKGKASGRPVAVVKGLSDLVLPVGDDGPGAQAIVRAADDDLFGLGSREAATAAALREDASALARFPSPAAGDADPFAGLASSHPDVAVEVSRLRSASGGAAVEVKWTVGVCVRADAETEAWVEAGCLIERARTLAAANRLRPGPDAKPQTPGDEWRAVRGLTWAIA